MKRVSAANMEGFREDIDLYAEIRALLPKLMDVLKNMNALTPEIHQQSGFSEIFDAVMQSWKRRGNHGRVGSRPSIKPSTNVAQTSCLRANVALRFLL